MHLLNTSTYKLHVDGESDQGFKRGVPYAILSHRWLTDEPEIKFKDVHPKFNPAGIASGNYASSHAASLSKITGACNVAREQKLEWIWIDTCCINKDSDAETTESINSMFHWYNEAKSCYAYLSDIKWTAGGSANSSMFKTQSGKRSGQYAEWFFRGWTLQELLASRIVEFYDGNWKHMGDKRSLSKFISPITRIDDQYLQNPKLVLEATVATKMSWMAGRTTTRVEDIAYSMLGIFGVTMQVIYSPNLGKKAFMKLQQAIIEDSDPDETIFAWKVPEGGNLKCFRESRWNQERQRNIDIDCIWKPAAGAWGVLAPSPDCFDCSQSVVIHRDKLTTRPERGYFWTQQGIQFQMSLLDCANMRWIKKQQIDAPLNCWVGASSSSATAVVIQLQQTGVREQYVRRPCDKWELKRGAKPGNTRRMGQDQGNMAMGSIVVQHMYL